MQPYKTKLNTEVIIESLIGLNFCLQKTNECTSLTQIKKFQKMVYWSWSIAQYNPKVEGLKNESFLVPLWIA